MWQKLKKNYTASGTAINTIELKATQKSSFQRRLNDHHEVNKNHEAQITATKSSVSYETQMTAMQAQMIATKPK